MTTKEFFYYITHQATFYLCISLTYQLQSSICFIKSLPDKQYYLIASSQKKDYVQINAFFASSSRVEKNLKVLQLKTTKS